MKITSLRLHTASVPRAYATQIAQEGGGARKLVERSSFVFIEAATDSGLTGWGEISDCDLKELGKLEAFQESLARFFVGRDPYDLQSLHADFPAAFPALKDLEASRLTTTALDMLCYDLQGLAARVPVYKLLGGEQRRRIHISWVAYIRDNLDLLRAEIHEKAAGGFTAFKLKVGVNIDLDEQRLAVLRKTAGPQAHIKLDANGGWTFEEAVRNIRRLEKYHLGGVETPIAGRKPEQLAALRKEVKVPLLEHVSTAEQALEYIKHQALDCFNIATTGCGGIWPARLIAQMAETAGIGILLGSTVELGPGTLAQLHLGASIRNLTMPSDLIGPGMYVDDVLKQRLYYDRGHLVVPEKPGLGREIDPTKLAKLRS